jgi:hypothetical protein
MEDGMQKFIAAFLLLVIITALQAKAFAAPLNCAFKDTDTRIQGVETLQITDEALVINEHEVIPLEHTRIKCGVFGRQDRFDGLGKRLQIILKSCTDEAVLKGQLIDAANSVVAEVVCN